MKKSIAVLSLTASILFTGACGTQSTKTASEAPKQTQQVKDEHLADVISYFKNKGYTIGTKTDKYYTMIGAIDGFGITLNNEPVEFYEFDKTDNATLGQVKKTGKLNTGNAYANGKFLMIDNVDQKIVQDFKEFK